MQEVAQRLKSLRESVGLSQAKLAALMGATQASVNRYENGQSSPPLKILRWYADFFDVSLDTEENIVSLCSNCHNKLHYGRDIEEMLHTLYNARKDHLTKVGIDISFSVLLRIYKKQTI